MHTKHTRFEEFLISLKLGFFLALRQIKRSSKATTALITFVMMLTFLNLVVVRGVLVGLIQGVVDVQKTTYIGDIFVSTLPKKDYIENTPGIIGMIKNLPWVESYTARYTYGGKIEGTYKDRINYTDKANEANAVIAGIDPEQEDSVSHLSEKIIEGSYLTRDDTESVLVGAYLLKKYLDIESSAFQNIENVDVGDKVRLTVKGNVREFTVKGVVKTKVDEVDMRVIMLDTTLRNLIGRTDYNANEISVIIKPEADPIMVKEALIKSGAGQTARVQTFEEGMPKFVEDMMNTFSLLGNIVGSIGLVVASITIFIVIFVNAITRRKFIGILKGIGISSKAIEIAYVFQSIFYAVLGIGAGMAVLYGILVPFIEANPIPFPFSDGILVAELPATLTRAFLLILATVVAGYIPARIVVKKNTLDSILGR